jgi:hypothetical protein
LTQRRPLPHRLRKVDNLRLAGGAVTGPYQYGIPAFMARRGLVDSERMYKFRLNEMPYLANRTYTNLEADNQPTAKLKLKKLVRADSGVHETRFDEFSERLILQMMPGSFDSR